MCSWAQNPTDGHAGFAKLQRVNARFPPLSLANPLSPFPHLISLGGSEGMVMVMVMVMVTGMIMVMEEREKVHVGG